MSAPAGYIDLDEDRSDPVVPVPARLSRRPWLAGAVLLACLLLAGPVPVRPGLVSVARLPSAATGTFTIAPDILVVLTGGIVTGYALPSGAQRWRTAVPATMDNVSYVAGTDTVLATGADGLVMAGLDYRTGRIGWQRDGAYPMAVLPTRRLAVVLVNPGQLFGIDLRSGRTAWQRSVPPNAADIPSRPDRGYAYYAALTSDHKVIIVDEFTGTPVASAVVDPGVTLVSASVVGRLLLSMSADGGGMTVTAYDIPRLARRWRTSLGPAPTTVAPCGGLVCLVDPDVIAVDPVTGTVRWRATDWNAVDAQPAGPLLLIRADQGPVLAAQLVEPGTGRRVLDLTGWTPISDSSTPTLLLSRDSRERRTSLAAVDLRARAVRVLGLVDDVLGDTCAAAGAYVVCQTVYGGLQVWRYSGVNGV